MRVLRSVLFVPGNSWRMIQKTTALGADAVVLDLEDAVPLAEKETARIFIRDALKIVKSGGSTVYVRTNSLDTGLTAEDLDAVVNKDLDGIMLPKTQSKKDVTQLEKMLNKLEKERKIKKGSIGIFPIVETALGVLYAYEIATASERVEAITFGAVDFTRDMGVTLTSEGQEFLYPRSHVGLVSVAAGIPAVDTVFVDLADSEGLVKDSTLAKQLGYRGKNVLHPRQIELVNKVFTPSEKDIERAMKVVRAFEEAEKQGLGAVSLDGKMIDIASYGQAQGVLAVQKAVAEREQSKPKAA